MVKALYDGRLATNIAGLKMKTPITTASGTFGFGLEFTDFLDLEKVGAVTVKGTSLEPQPGNKGQRAVETPSGMLNSIGLENPGVDYFLETTLPQLLDSGKYDCVYVCGPVPMMKAVAEVAAEKNIKCQVSLEKYMACGLGACLSCSCSGIGKRLKVCTDGPVFWAEEVGEW